MKAKFYTRVLLAAALIASAPVPAFAAPVISSISNPFAHRIEVTITGSGFGTKSPAKPLVWAHFDDGRIEADASLSTETLGFSDAEITSVNQPPGSAFSVRSLPGNFRIYTSVPNPPEGTRYSYQFIRRNYDHSNFFDNIGFYKNFRNWPTLNFSGQSNAIIEFHGNTNIPAGCSKRGYDIAFRHEGIGATQIFARDFCPQVQQWVRQELQVFHGSGIDVPDSSMWFWQNGVLPGTANPLTGMVGLTADDPDLWRSLGVENFFTNSTLPSGARIYMDDYYADKTWARVMIGNRSTFNSSTHREIQIPTAWSQDSITVVVNQGALPSFVDTFLYVIDASGNVNSQGFPLNASSPPVAPLNLRIQ